MTKKKTSVRENFFERPSVSTGGHDSDELAQKLTTQEAPKKVEEVKASAEVGGGVEKSQKNKEEIHPFYLPNSSVRVSQNTLHRLNTLKPYIRMKISSDKVSSNEIVDELINYYLKNELTQEQREQYKEIFELMTDSLK